MLTADLIDDPHARASRIAQRQTLFTAITEAAAAHRDKADCEPITEPIPVIDSCDQLPEGWLTAN